MIDAAIAGDTNLKMLGPYGAGDAGVENIRCRNTVYVPAPYVSLLLGEDLTPIEAWHLLMESIVDATAEEAYRPLIDWIRAALIRDGPNTYSALMVPKPLAPLPNVLLLQHCHRLLLSHLPGVDSSINRAAGTNISKTVGDVAV